MSANNRRVLLMLEEFIFSLTVPLMVRIHSVEAELVWYHSCEIEHLLGLIVLRI
jgi:hypothetical protein